MHKPTQFFDRHRRRLGMAVGCLGVLLLLASVGGYWDAHHTLLQHSQPAPKSVDAAQTVVASDTPAHQNSKSRTSTNTSTKTSALSEKTTNSSKAASAKQPTHIPTPPDAKIITVTLKINDTQKGSISLPEGSDQCQVLTQALKDGQISSLTMKYNSMLKTNGVYVIDGIGSSDEVNWTYKINGSNPPVGCSLVNAKNGDAIEWKYVK